MLLLQPLLIQLCPLPFLFVALNALDLRVILQRNFFTKTGPSLAHRQTCESSFQKSIAPWRMERLVWVSAEIQTNQFTRCPCCIVSFTHLRFSDLQFSISSDLFFDLHHQIFNDIKQLIHPLSTTISTVSDRLDALDSRITRLEPEAITSSSSQWQQQQFSLCHCFSHAHTYSRVANFHSSDRFWFRNLLCFSCASAFSLSSTEMQY